MSAMVGVIYPLCSVKTAGRLATYHLARGRTRPAPKTWRSGYATWESQNEKKSTSKLCSGSQVNRVDNDVADILAPHASPVELLFNTKREATRYRIVRSKQAVR